ncbi:MAG TPA: family 1 encapsulin nanocompartment shell protein [Thermoleophilaceae bacterium]|nr:family 1 encapsulin nanocompartment shell protein [Thermoleophilaceae bacterium]
MSENHLLRDLAPITSAAWAEIDQEARERLVAALAARRLVDFSGPHGWQHSATNLGRTETVAEAPCEGVGAKRRRVLPLAELRAPFSVAREELRAGDRGAVDVDLDELVAAARRMAVAENKAVFHGWSQAGVTGITEASSHPEVQRSADFDEYPSHVARAVEALLRSGVAGPYGLALGTEDYTGVIETAEHGGYPLFDHLGKILGGPIVWSPGVRGAVVLSQRGEDFLFESGQDLAVGYDDHDREVIHLYIEESFSFRVATPEAAVALVPA